MGIQHPDARSLTVETAEKLLIGVAGEMTAEDDVRAASKAFYAALNRMLSGDAGSLTDIWVHSPEATTMHPIGDRQVGWDQIKGSFERVARSSTGGHVEITDQLFRVHGDMAYEVGVEHAAFGVSGTQLTVNSRVTNIYFREGDGWKVIHHHGDKSPGISEALDKAEPA
ncbi:YybH family protein [Agromyces binzhouensis]|uniref:YybH family protein n=1 Tax=Agromyces binzhouensis TaxID=1817495 RepID=UPI003638D9FE